MAESVSADSEAEVTNFLSLPRELRDEIYHLAITTDKPVDLCAEPQPCITGFDLTGAQTQVASVVPRMRTIASLSQTSCQVRFETHEIIATHKNYELQIKDRVSIGYSGGCPTILRHVARLLIIRPGEYFLPNIRLERTRTGYWTATFEREAQRKAYYEPWLRHGVPKALQAGLDAVSHIVESKGTEKGISSRELEEITRISRDVWQIREKIHWAGRIASVRAKMGKGMSEKELEDEAWSYLLY